MNLKTISPLIAILVVFSGVLWQGWAVKAEVKKNTEWRIVEEYSRLKKWIKAEEVECGKDAKDCAELNQDILARWKIRFKELNKKLGYEEAK